MAQHQQIACTVFPSRESKSFNLRINNSATRHLSGDECVSVDVSIPAAAGFTCTATYWPNITSGWIKIAVVITRTDDQHRHNKLLVANLDLPPRTGLTPPSRTVKPETFCTTTCCSCNEGGSVVRRDSKEGMEVKREPVVTATSDSCRCKEGVSLMARRADVEAKCVVDDHFTAICTVAVPKFWPPLPLPTLPRLEHDILTASDDLTDVSCQVDGETFRAHRLVLAARSPVLRAELFGHQQQQHQHHHQQQQEKARSSTTTVLAVQDMRASTFRSMLHYMYHGLLPVVAPPVETAAEADRRVSEFQSLYVAADRYALDTLRQTCEEILCASVTTDTVLSNLQFAEERACVKLRSRCLDFLAVGEKFKAVAVTNEYIDLMKRVPSLLDHVQNRFKRPRLS